MATKQNINILLGYLSCDDPVIKTKYENLLASFWHKDEGIVIKGVASDGSGGSNITFSDDSVLNVPALPTSKPISFITGLIDALNAKVSSVAGKQLSEEDFTTEFKNKLAGLSNYIHPETHLISEVQGLQSIINTLTLAIKTHTSELTNDGAAGDSYFVEDKDLPPVAKSGSYLDLTDRPTIRSVENTYADILALLADQVNQTAGNFQSVIDASGDPTVASGYAYYEYLGTTLGTMADYRKLSEQESMDLIEKTKLSQFENDTNFISALSIRDNNNVEQFASDYIQFEGVVFDVPNKRIKFQRTYSQYKNAYVDNVNGSDTLGRLNDITAPFKTIDAVFDLYDRGVELAGTGITIELLKDGTYPILKGVPYIDLIIKSDKVVTIDFSNNISNNTHFTANGSNQIFIYFNIPLGKLLNNNTNTLNTIFGVDDASTWINCNIVEWRTVGANSRVFRGRIYIINIRSLILSTSLGQKAYGNFNFDYVEILSTYNNNNGFVQPYSFPTSYPNQISIATLNLGGDISTWFNCGGGVTFNIYNVTGTGVISFAYYNGSTVRFVFHNCDVTNGFKFAQNSGNFIISGHIRTTVFNNVFSSNLGVIFENLIIDTLTGFYQVHDGSPIFRNCIINVAGKLVHKVNGVGSVTFENCIINQTTPTHLIENLASGITVNVNGLQTNATKLVLNNTATVVNKDKNIMLQYMPTYANDTDAGVGGIAIGQGYINSTTGALHRRLT